MKPIEIKGVNLPVKVSGANDGFGWRVYAYDDITMIVGPLAQTEDEAIRKWNDFAKKLQPGY